jgi:ankyrin repeat protein
MEVLRYKLDSEGADDRARASNLFWDWDDDLDTLENLFKNETKSVKTAAFGMYPLYYPGSDFVETMLRIGASPDYSDADDWSFLSIVLNHGDDEALKVLLKYAPVMRVVKCVAAAVLENGSQLAKETVAKCEIVNDIYD